MSTIEESSDLLEEMLKRCEASVFPHLRELTEAFVDTVNHAQTQKKIKNQLQQFDDRILYVNNLIERCLVADCANKKLALLEELLLECDKITDPLPFFTKFQNAGLFGLVNDKEFDFLHRKELTFTARVQQFISIFEKVEDVSKEEFDKYMKEWESNQRKWARDEAKMEDDAKKIREEFYLAIPATSQKLETSFSENLKNYDPLHQNLVESVASDTNVKGTQTTDTQSNNKQWNRGLYKFIEKGKLNPNLQHLNILINPWLITLKQNIFTVSDKSFHFPKALMLKEVERMSNFLYAVILNKPEMLQQHQQLLNEIIQEAGQLHENPNNNSIIPLVCIGQLPLSGGERKRVISFQFVLDNSLSKDNVEFIHRQLCSIFSYVSTEISSVQSVPVIQLDIHVEKNVPSFISNFIPQLAALKIRSILIGEFGSKGFRHAMNQDFSRIYSMNPADRTVGFKLTCFNPLDRGGEPYFCPYGWRRYSIDVGMSDKEFESKYGDWPVAYYSTEGHVAMAILLNGMRASGHACFIKRGENEVYVSPSIEYCGHPRYAKVWEVNSKYVQMVLQVRVSRRLLFDKKPGSLPGTFAEDPPIDNNFTNNNELEWVIKWPPGMKITIENGILIYGIMMRVTTDHPSTLAQNEWWQSTE